MSTAPLALSADGMPTRIGRYRVVQPIASGGMGTVYLAFAEGPMGFDRWVAIKRVHPHLASDAKFVGMFQDEARIVSRITHPNVCGLLDYGAGPEGHWLVMPYLFGESLHRVRRTAYGKDSPLRETFPYLAARIVEMACEGLHAAHELTDETGKSLEVVHRDISPQNLHVGYDGTVHVLDFGVATARQRLVTTATGEVKGKFAYMAPEQLDGKQLDRRADVFAMGVVLYESLTGRRLFARETMTETVKAVLSEPVPALREVWPEAPVELEEVVSKALARDPQRRYPTARALSRDLSLALTEVRRGVGIGDISDAMTTLFPGALEQRRHAMEESRQNRVIDEVSQPDPERSMVTLAGSARRGVATPSDSGRSRGLVIAALAVLLLVVAAIGGYASFGGTGEPSNDAANTGVATGASEASSAVATVAAPVEEEVEEVEDLEVAEVEEAEEVGVAEMEVADVAEVEGADEAGSADEAPSSPDGPSVRRGHRDRPPATATGPGSVSVATPGGWAVVYESGTRLGDAPGTFSLPAGTHTLEVQPFGRGERLRRRVRVSAGETSRLVIPVEAP
jgi:serine/threonine-protein kinase